AGRGAARLRAHCEPGGRACRALRGEPASGAAQAPRMGTATRRRARPHLHGIASVHGDGVARSMDLPVAEGAAGATSTERPGTTAHLAANRRSARAEGAMLVRIVEQTL